MAAGLTERLKSLAGIASLVNAGNALAETLESITLAVCQRTAWSSSAIMALDETAGLSILVARHDPWFAAPPGQPAMTDRWDLATSPTRAVLAAGQPLVIDDAREAADYPGYQAEARARDYRTVVLLPLGARDGEGRGMVMSVHAHQRVAVDADELAFLETVAHLASLAVDKALRLRLERQKSEQFRQALEIQASALELVLAGGDLVALADLGERFLGRPFLLLDLTASTLLGRGLRELPREPSRALAEWLQSAPPGFSERRLLPPGLPGLPAVSEVAAGTCVIEGATLGAVLVFTEGRELEAPEALVAEELRFALAVLLLRAQARFAARAETLEDFFARLFSGNWRDPAELLARARHLGLRVQEPARLALLRIDADAGEGRERRGDLLRLLQRLVRPLPGAAACFDGEACLVFLPEGRGGETAQLALVRRLLDEATWLLGRPPLLALSRLCRQLEDLRPARQDAAQLIELARHVGRRGLVRAEEFGPFARFLAAADREALRGLMADTLGRIEAQGDSLLATLEVFLTEQGRYQATADRLGVHVTTLRYRLRRLAELCDLDLEQPDTRLALQLAFRLRGLFPP